MVVEVMGRYAGLDRALRRRGGRRRRHPDSRDSVRHREDRRAHPRRANGSAPASASSWSPKARSRSAARSSLVKEAQGEYVERLGGMGALVAAEHREADRQGNAQRRARASAARRRADQLRPRAGHAVRRQGGRAGAAGAVRHDGGVPPARHRRRPARERRRTTRNVPLDFDVHPTARAMGISLGDESKISFEGLIELARIDRSRVRSRSESSTSRYFSAPPVLNRTTVSVGLMRPSRSSTRAHGGRRRLRGRR